MIASSPSRCPDERATSHPAPTATSDHDGDGDEPSRPAALPGAAAARPCPPRCRAARRRPAWCTRRAGSRSRRSSTSPAARSASRSRSERSRNRRSSSSSARRSGFIDGSRSAAGASSSLANAAATSARSSSVGIDVGGGLAAPAPERERQPGQGADQRGHRQRPHEGVEARRPRHEQDAPAEAGLDHGDDLVVVELALVDELRRSCCGCSPTPCCATRTRSRPGTRGRRPAARWPRPARPACSARRPGWRRRRGSRRRRTRAAPTPATASRPGPASRVLLPQQLQLGAEEVGRDP